MDQPIPSAPPVFTQAPVEPEPPIKNLSPKWFIVLIHLLLFATIIFLFCPRPIFVQTACSQAGQLQTPCKAGKQIVWENSALVSQFLLKQDQGSYTAGPMHGVIITSPSPDPAADWKTYTNTQYSYSLKHPDEWEEIINPISEGKEFTFKLPNGEFVHGTVFNGARDSTNDNSYRKTFDLANNRYILITYVECDGPGCEFGKLDLPTFTQILSTFRFTDPSEATLKVQDCYAKTQCSGGIPCMANPAAVFCTCMGGKLEIRENDQGQAGFCLIDGQEYDEWEYFRTKNNL